jgi:tetratricopeptide (TPR) repeat protein
MAHWDLIASGNDPVGRGTFIVQTLRRLNSESKLTAEQALWLPKAEQGLAYDLNERCWDEAKAGQLEAALADCEESLKLAPNAAPTLDSRAFVRLKMGEYDAAITDYDAALRLDPKLPTALYGRGLAKLRKGDVAGGHADIAAAQAMSADIAAEFERIGVR